MLFANAVVREVLTLLRQVAMRQLIAGQSLMLADPGAIKNRERGTCKPAHVDLVGV